MTRNLVFLLEEPSARTMLEQILPELIGTDVSVYYLVFEGKQDLERNLKRKLSLWQKPGSAFMVLRDQDSADCVTVKKHLMDICRQAGCPEAVVRIACHELESFYLGDLDAVSQAYQMTMPSQESKKFRAPDCLANAAEELSKITKAQYQKIDGSRRIAPRLKLDGSNLSRSFNVLCEGIRKLCPSPSWRNE